jgi:hypothetical protein
MQKEICLLCACSQVRIDAIFSFSTAEVIAAKDYDLPSTIRLMKARKLWQIGA